MHMDSYLFHIVSYLFKKSAHLKSAHLHFIHYLYPSIIFIANNERRFKPERYTC
jgi:hypothetical protein